MPRASRVLGTLSAIIPIPAQTHQPFPRCAPKFHFLVLANATSSPWTSKHKSSGCIPRCLYNLPSPAHQSLRPVASSFITSRHPSQPFYFAAHGSTQAAVSLFVILVVFLPLLLSDADGPWLSPQSPGVGICRKQREPPGWGSPAAQKTEHLTLLFSAEAQPRGAAAEGGHSGGV